MKLEHRPDTGCDTRVEEEDLHGSPGSNMRVRVLSNDCVYATVRVEDCGVNARQGELYEVAASVLNGGRR